MSSPSTSKGRGTPVGIANAVVRAFLPIFPAQPGQKTWSDVAFEYVEALEATSTPFICCSLNWAGDLSGGDVHTARWHRLREHFIGTFAPKYVNLVIGVTPVETRNLSHGRLKLPGVKEIIGKDEPILVSDPDLVRLFTVGCANVAIIGRWPRPLQENEISALRDYDRVLVPEPEDLEWANAVGITWARLLPPTDHDGIRELLEELLR